MAQSPQNADRTIDILIVCTGNICRSPMAEGLLKSMWPKELDLEAVIHSAGTHASEGLPAEPYAVRAASEYGVDIRAHRSRLFDPGIVTSTDLILALAQPHVDFIRNTAGGELKNVRLLCGFNAAGARWDVPDPYGGSLETYRECVRMIRDCLAHVVIQLEENYDGTKLPDPAPG